MDAQAASLGRVCFLGTRCSLSATWPRPRRSTSQSFDYKRLIDCGAARSLYGTIEDSNRCCDTGSSTTVRRGRLQFRGARRVDSSQTALHRVASVEDVQRHDSASSNGAESTRSGRQHPPTTVVDRGGTPAHPTCTKPGPRRSSTERGLVNPSKDHLDCNAKLEPAVYGTVRSVVREDRGAQVPLLPDLGLGGSFGTLRHGRSVIDVIERGPAFSAMRMPLHEGLFSFPTREMSSS